MEDAHKDQGIVLSPEKKEQIKKGHLEMVDLQANAWEAFPEWKKITDEAIQEILYELNSESSDEARSAILRLYSYETPLYGALNKANQYKDQRAIQTLGPFACLLDKILDYPPKENMEAQAKKATITGKDRYGRVLKRITLYRGLGLPAKAI